VVTEPGVGKRQVQAGMQQAVQRGNAAQQQQQQQRAMQMQPGMQHPGMQQGQGPPEPPDMSVEDMDDVTAVAGINMQSEQVCCGCGGTLSTLNLEVVSEPERGELRERQAEGWGEQRENGAKRAGWPQPLHPTPQLSFPRSPVDGVRCRTHCWRARSVTAACRRGPPPRSCAC
jgi:hypothetical protein